MSVYLFASLLLSTVSHGIRYSMEFRILRGIVFEVFCAGLYSNSIPLTSSSNKGVSSSQSSIGPLNKQQGLYRLRHGDFTFAQCSCVGV
jgi:hypothetical protein